MSDELPKYGRTIVRIADQLESTRGLLIEQHFLHNRTPGIKGIYFGWVGGHGGDVWWICHETNADGTGKRATAAAYSFTEVEIIKECDEPLKNWSGFQNKEESKKKND